MGTASHQERSPVPRPGPSSDMRSSLCCVYELSLGPRLSLSDAVGGGVGGGTQPVLGSRAHQGTRT